MAHLIRPPNDVQKLIDEDPDGKWPIMCGHYDGTLATIAIILGMKPDETSTTDIIARVRELHT